MLKNLHQALKMEIAYQHNSSSIEAAHLRFGQLIMYPLPSALNTSTLLINPQTSRQIYRNTGPDTSVVWPHSQVPPLAPKWKNVNPAFIKNAV